MSRSKRDQRGKRINGEIGRECAIIGDRVVTRFGWDMAGSPIRKRSAKRTAARMNRRIGKKEATA